MVDEDMSQLLRGYGLMNWDEERHLGQHANKGGNGVIGLASGEGEGGGKISDEIHGDVRPGAGGDGVGLKETGRELGRGFDPLTSGT